MCAQRAATQSQKVCVLHQKLTLICVCVTCIWHHQQIRAMTPNVQEACNSSGKTAHLENTWNPFERFHCFAVAATVSDSPRRWNCPSTRHFSIELLDLQPPSICYRCGPESLVLSSSAQTLQHCEHTQVCFLSSTQCSQSHHTSRNQSHIWKVSNQTSINEERHQIYLK